MRLTGVSEESISIEWSAPLSAGGLPILNYIIEIRESRSYTWNYVATVSSRSRNYTIQYLQPQKSYYVRVAAENEEGIGYFKELTEAIHPRKQRSTLIFN